MTGTARQICYLLAALSFAAGIQGEPQDACAQYKGAARGACNAYVNSGACAQSGNGVACAKLKDATCGQLTAALQSNRFFSCRSDFDCGQVLPGTSCGCTRNWVANLDTDVEEFQALQQLYWQLGCSGLFISRCDCPPADGFACVLGECTWNYTNPP